MLRTRQGGETEAEPHRGSREEPEPESPLSPADIPESSELKGHPPSPRLRSRLTAAALCRLLSAKMLLPLLCLVCISALGSQENPKLMAAVGPPTPPRPPQPFPTQSPPTGSR